MLPYQGEKGLRLTKSLKRNFKSLLPTTVKINVGFTCKKLGTCFQIKDQTNFEHKYESWRRISKIIIDHNGRDKKFHIFKHNSEKCHQHFHTNSFKEQLFQTTVEEQLFQTKSLRSTTNQANQSITECSREFY